MHRTIAALVGGAAAATAAVALAGPAQAAPPSNGCPSSWTRIHYATDLPAGVYQVPAQVDSPQNSYSFGHQPGNDNGYVCALPLGNRSFDGYQLYNFMDDSLLGEG